MTDNLAAEMCYEMFPFYNLRQLNSLHASVISNDSFGALAVKCGFNVYIKNFPVLTKTSIAKYAEMPEKQTRIGHLLPSSVFICYFSLLL